MTKTADLSQEAAPVETDTVKVKSPWGFVTEVPKGLVEVLVESGYSKTK